MVTNINCPIWGTPATEFPPTDHGNKLVVNSPRAGGKYLVTGTAVSMLTSRSDPDKVKLTSWLVEQRRLGVDCPEVTIGTLKQIENQRPLNVHERADALLRYLAAKSDMLGHVVQFYSEDNSKAPATPDELLAWTASRKLSEVMTLTEYCGERGWISRRVSEPIHLDDVRGDSHELMLKPPGYARLAELDAVGTASEQAFVAMWFDESMNDAYEIGIAPAIQDAGYKSLRIDRKDHNNKIDDEIIAELRRSRFVVADFLSVS